MSDYSIEDIREGALHLAWVLDDCADAGFYACCLAWPDRLRPRTAFDVLPLLFPGACEDDFEFRQSPCAPEGFWTLAGDSSIHPYFHDCAEDFRLVFNEETGFVSVDVTGRFERLYNLMRRFTGACVMFGGAPVFNNDFHQEEG